MFVCMCGAHVCECFQRLLWFVCVLLLFCGREQEREFGCGETLMMEGDLAESFFIVDQGEVCVFLCPYLHAPALHVPTLWVPIFPFMRLPSACLSSCAYPLIHAPTLCVPIFLRLPSHGDMPTRRRRMMMLMMTWGAGEGDAIEDDEQCCLPGYPPPPFCTHTHTCHSCTKRRGYLPMHTHTVLPTRLIPHPAHTQRLPPPCTERETRCKVISVAFLQGL